jgi:hypothetical protein
MQLSLRTIVSEPLCARVFALKQKTAVAAEVGEIVFERNRHGSSLGLLQG